MSPRKAAAKYGPDDKYYRNRLAAASDVPPQELYFYEYAAAPREIRAIINTALAPYQKSSTELSTA